MAKGFITLDDGRGFAPRWRAYDMVLQLVIDGLGEDPYEQKFKQFLQGLIPNPDVPEENSTGDALFVRQSDGLTIFRNLDLRSLTRRNQQLFWEALQRSYRNIRLGAPHQGTELFWTSVRKLLRMRRAAARRTSPYVDNDWSDGVLEPFDGTKIVPGWVEEP
ncbi:hypothetical protein [Hymenobacter cellulosivorans]|uniref:Uncharacterized protein n=1 Tax=Hymenobacter cellulosivorans TaxID=2932249 RepID=A0ABY4F341_9BACT|nr:hypothetical protein [Hymenobacter cellulosivorans]UOQ51081.1 hypothetical protein MUN80_15075 [Hymenobacter cellulosivorans]